MRCSTRLATIVWFCVFAFVQVSDGADEFFESRVRPILVARCVECHGARKQESGLRLDTKAGFERGGDSGPVFHRDNPESSELLLVVGRQGTRKMPPDKALSDAEVRVLTEWIRRGAEWPIDAAGTGKPAVNAAREHWAFQPIREPHVPRITGPNIAVDDWSQSPIDRFVLKRLLDEGLHPSAVADRRTLLRRASFGLLGLPPTIDEVRAFQTNDAPDAWAQTVDRLLASPQYGERWGRHWLDVARYADTKGYVFFEEKKFPWAWTYRDYVLRSFNEDLPFDRFITEQLAADQLELGDDKRPLTAMGFLTLGGRFMNNLHDVLDDRIDVVTRGLMGVTVTCARCHDHKFDPIPQADYYSLYGVFRSSIEPTVPPEFLPPPTTEDYTKFTSEMNARLKKLNDFVFAKHAALVASARARAAEYLLAAQAQTEKPPTDDFMLLADTADINPTMTLRWQVALESAKKQPHPVWQVWNEFAAIPADQFAARSAEVCAKLITTERPNAVNPLLVSAVCGEKPPQSLNEVATRFGELFQRIDAKWQDARKLSVSNESTERQPPSQLADPLEEQIRSVLYGRDAPADVPLAMGWGFLSLFPDRATQAEYQKLVKEVEQWSMTAVGAPARAMVLVDDAATFEPRLFLRGNPNRLGQFVPRQNIAIASFERHAFEHGSGRLELAKSIIDPRNPLTARVFVNRVWMHHFGSGLVKTPSDLGVRSDPPSHPELLDWLAFHFIKSGWSVKWLHRQIMLSAVYRQKSDELEGNGAVSGSASLRDPENRLLSRFSRRRLDWESLRDSMLLVSGDLNRRLGGESLEVLNGFVPRRSMYGVLDRLDVPNLLTTFDFPTPAATNPQRDSTTVAPQALFLMNGDFAFEAATRLARNSNVPPTNDSLSRIVRMFETSLQRAPTVAERSAAEEFLGNAPPPERWIAFAHSLLLLNEFAFVD